MPIGDGFSLVVRDGQLLSELNVETTSGDAIIFQTVDWGESDWVVTFGAFGVEPPPHTELRRRQANRTGVRVHRARLRSESRQPAGR